ncbi:MAG: DUF4258 domain-containing protein [Phycisphaerae bacterium]
MSETFRQVAALVKAGEVRVSDHGYDELAADGIFAGDVLGGVSEAVVLEDYPNYPKGPCVLVLESDSDGNPIHVVWGIPKGTSAPAVLVTAYRPDPARWTDQFTRRKP